MTFRDPDVNSVALILIGIILVGAVASAASRMLRAVRSPGASLLGGLCAGILLGPGVFGRAAPAAHIALFEGDRSILAQFESSDREHRAALLASTAPQAAGAPMDALVAELATQRDVALEAWNTERERHRALIVLAILMTGAIVLLAAGAASSVRGPARRHQLTESMLNAAWSTSVPFGLTMLALQLGGVPLLAPSSLMLACSMSCGAWCVSRSDRAIARAVVWGGAALVEQSARWASAFVLPIACAALLMSAPLPLACAGVVTLCCLPLGWFVRVRLVRFADHVALPALVALSLLNIEPFHDWMTGFVIIAYVIAEDGRWLGGWIGHWTAGGAGRSAGKLSAMRLTFAGLSVAPTMAVLTAVGFALGVLDPRQAFAALLAATAVAVLTNARSSAARRLALAEAELASAA